MCKGYGLAPTRLSDERMIFLKDERRIGFSGREKFGVGECIAATS